MKKIKLALIALVFTVSGYSQTAAYFELGGPGLASFNFDTRFTGKNDGIGGRVGVGGFSIDGQGVVFIPIGLNYLVGKDGKNFFEVGGGITPLIASGEFADDDGTFSTTFGHLLFGYRMQPSNGGFSFRAFISPIFGKGYFIPYYGGVSFGYAFGRKNR